MITDLRRVTDLSTMLSYFATSLDWNIDMDYIEDIDDLLFDYKPELFGLTDEYHAKIKSANQIRPLVEDQPWGIFAIEFDSNHFEVSALRKVLSGLVPKRRNADHAVWDKKNLLFLCFWGDESHRTVAVAYFEDKDMGLPQIKVLSWAPQSEDAIVLARYKEKLGNLAWPTDANNYDAWHEKWTRAFITVHRQTIRDSATITAGLAEMAIKIKDQIISTLKVESANGYVHLLLDKFRNTLIHDMTDSQFADMYAQTIVYGLFTARCMDADEHFDPNDAVENIPNTNPFLKKLLKDCLSQDNKNLTFDELELEDVIELLRYTDIKSILFDWNRQTGGGKEDPVLYFYEGFLNAYESEQKRRRGVYYTPQPVVIFIVRAVDDILRSEFGIEDGLASTATKTINIKRDSKKKIDGFTRQVDDTEEVPAIQILDPATGTGTFLRQTIIQIWENFKVMHKGKVENEINRLWNEYVPKHLLPRLNGFELMMAPYAVAHMKLAMVLQETGYDFSSNDRIKVFLTNSLEEPGNSDMQIKLWDDPLATESLEANREKKNTGINVIIGNPPYSGISANNSEYMNSLIEPYKYTEGVHFGEKKHWLQDDYVKFIRYAQTIVERSGAGIVAFVNPHGFIDNPTFRSMRWNLLQSFHKMYILDLHGNSNRQESCPDGSKDENVFDIQQGVSVAIFIKKRPQIDNNLCIYHFDLYGLRSEKYDYLLNNRIVNVNWSNVNPIKPYYFFSVKDLKNIDTYDNGFRIDELFILSSVGAVTANDTLNISFSREEQIQKIDDLQRMQENQWRSKYCRPKDSRDWTFNTAKRDSKDFNPSCMQEMSYRPFDTRYTYYTGNSRGLYSSPQKNVLQHFLSGNNVGIVVSKRNRQN